MNTRQIQIMNAAIALFLRDGIGVSTAAIAKAAGVSNGTLFNAFPSKQALIDAIYLTTKSGMFDALGAPSSGPLTRAALRRTWDAYLAWARAVPEHLAVMRLLLESGLASDAVKAEVNARAAPHAARLQAALDAGDVRAPNVAFIGELIFFHTDLVIAQDLDADDADLAFTMLCNAIGLTP